MARSSSAAVERRQWHDRRHGQRAEVHIGQRAIVEVGAYGRGDAQVRSWCAQFCAHQVDEGPLIVDHGDCPELFELIDDEQDGAANGDVVQQGRRVVAAGPSTDRPWRYGATRW